MFERRSGLAQPEPWLIEALGGRPTAAGVRVTERTALTISAVWSALNILAQNIGTLPLPVIQKTADGRFSASDRPLHWTLNRRANREMTAATFRQTMMLHLGLWRNFYAHIEINGAGDVIGLWPLMPDRTGPVRVGGVLFFDTILPDGTGKRLRQDEVLHIIGPSLNGIEAESMVKMARETLGQILATQEFGSRLFGQGLNASGFITSEAPLEKTQREQIAQQVNEQVQGLTKAHNALILPFALKWQPMSTDPQKAQMLETREFLVTEVARWFNLPPHKLGVANKGMSYASVEQMQLAFVQEALRPWLVMIEQAIDVMLFTETEQQQGFYVEHKLDALLRADSKTRAEVLHIQRLDGIINADEWRALENMNPQPDGQGEVYWMPVNMIAADKAGPGDPGGGPANAGRSSPAGWEQRAQRVGVKRKRMADNFRTLFADAETRIVAREKADILKKARAAFGKRDAADFDRWLTEFFTKHPEYIRERMWPVLRAYAEAIQADAADEIGGEVGMTPKFETEARDYLEAFIARHVGSSKGQITQVVQRAAAENGDPVAALEERFAEWEATRPEKVARRESSRAREFFTRAAYILAGITKIRWNASSETCPACQRLHGKVIGIQTNFVHHGEELSMGEGNTPLSMSTNVSHPPAHDGCDCFITAET